MSCFFSSDTHFWHHNILQYSSRPFNNVEDMNAEICKRWNARVGLSDTVYFLGDFAMGPRSNIEPMRKRLNGRIVLIRGNHDRSASAMLEAGFDEVHNELFLKIEDKEVYLRHIPKIDFTGDFHLCGHVHKEWKRNGNIINVGVDVSEFMPLTFSELLARDS